jgi:hypothetical protein
LVPRRRCHWPRMRPHVRHGSARPGRGLPAGSRRASWRRSHRCRSGARR